MTENGITNPQAASDDLVASKGKGKAVAEDVPEDVAMDEDDEDDDDEEDDDEEPAEAEDDGMDEIDLNNIVEGGRRTRGTKIDFAKAAEELPADEEDEEDDDDFQPPDEDTEMKE